MADTLIRDYYDCFNSRRFADAARLFARDAVAEYPPSARPESGPEAFAAFADMWLQAFPDGCLTIAEVQQRGDTICEVHLLATGTHRGTLHFGPFGVFKPTGLQLRLRVRQLFEVRFERITYSSLSFDVQDLVRQLAIVDYPGLLARLDRLNELRQALVAAGDDEARRRTIADRVGPELDAARHALRPHFDRRVMVPDDATARRSA